MSGKLLPCPLCGCGEIVEYEPPGWPGGWTIACAACGCSVARYNRNESRKSWNTRTATTDEQFAQAIHDGCAWEPVRTCRWELAKRGTVYDVYGCSACGYEYAEPVTDGGVLVSIGDASYCPSCGAKVIGECER